MVVCVNDNFKIPVGYFLSNGLSGNQKLYLIKQCLILLRSFNVNVISLTFDGLSSNFLMLKLLDCNLESLLSPPSKQENYAYQYSQNISFINDENTSDFVQKSLYTL